MSSHLPSTESFSGVQVVYKPQGRTPLEAVVEFKSQNPQFADVKIGYAGRLDPMAEGLLLLMIGEENKNRDSYQMLDKTYSLSVLFGVATDTFDILGLIQQSALYESSHISAENLKSLLTQFEGEIEQQFPPYSAKRMNGKPLYYWALRGKLAPSEIPTAKRHVHSLELSGLDWVQKDDLSEKIMSSLSNVAGNFRQAEIIQKWQDYFEKAGAHQHRYAVAELNVHCSSGTYMRSIAHNLGIAIGIPACALRIVRTKIGPYDRPTSEG